MHFLQKNTNFGGPFFDNNDEDDDVRRIAQQMEAKYVRTKNNYQLILIK